MLILAALCLSLSVFLALEYSSVSARQVKAQIRRAGSYAVVDQREKELSRSARERLLAPAARRMAEFGTRLSPQASRMLLARKLQAAGVSTSPQRFLAVKGGLTAGGLIVCVAGVVLGVGVLVPLGVMGAALAYIGPDMVLNSKARARRDEMARSLPDVLDLLTVSVEAGLGFDSAVAKVCEKMRGPLIDELQLVSREIRIGETRRQALRNMSDRIGSDEVSSFTRAIIQAEELGTSLGRTLRVQSVDMRIKRQLAAEEKAMKAPVKMLFPTVMFIFPAMFVVILGPAALNIMAAFQGM